MLVASSNEPFLRRFQSACAAASISVAVATDGYEALTRLEQGGIDALLVDGGYLGSKNALNGIPGDELAHMWRQIEGRGSHLIIGYVTERDSLEAHDGQIIDVSKASMTAKLDGLAATVGRAGRAEPQPSRFFLDPAIHALNRGVDHHFWSDQADAEFICEIVEAVAAGREAVSKAVQAGADCRVSRLADHKRSMG